MVQKVFLISLSFILTFATIGAAKTEIFCELATMAQKDQCNSCYEDDNCCEYKVSYKKLSVDMQALNDELEIPSIEPFYIHSAPEISFTPHAALSKWSSVYAYRPPPITKDINVLVQCFRL